MTYQVWNTETETSHGVYRTLDEARGCVAFDRLQSWIIWGGHEAPAYRGKGQSRDTQFIAEYRIDASDDA